MDYLNRAVVGVLAASCVALFTTGCTSTVSKNVNGQGQAEEVVFPALGKADAVKEGIFPNLENLRKIDAGIAKDDLYYLVGAPHFREMHGAREWDYIFKFRNAADNSVSVCQYKVIFDTEMKGRSFYWLPSDCAKHLGAAKVPAEHKKVVSLKADALFAFNKYSGQDLRMEGRAELDRLAKDLLEQNANAGIVVRGYTDYLGSTAYNQQLSAHRAETVRQYLVEKGLPAGNIKAIGMGESHPVVQCNASQPRNALIACLQPNRRVDVEVQ